MQASSRQIPDSTAVRVALWRALHTEVDAPPHVLDDSIGLRLAAPDEHWRERPDMHPEHTAGYRAAIVGRSRFIEDLVIEQVGNGIDQYVVLGAGLDSFAQRHPEIGTRLRVFEIDQPDTQAWKLARLIELGYGVPDWLRLVPVDFEAGESWWDKLADTGFERSRPAVVVSTGVSMYLTKDANVAVLRQMATMAPGSTLAMTFLLPLELIDISERAQHAAVYERARAAGTPFISFFTPDEMVALAHAAGFTQARHISSGDLAERYFSGRSDGLRPAHGEAFLIAST